MNLFFGGKMKNRILLIICLFLLLIVGSILDSFNHTYKDQPEKADAIVMLGGGYKGRMMKAAELYHEGYVNYVLITPVIESELSTQSTQLAIDLGIPEEGLIKEYEATSTYTNAIITIDIMNDLDMDSALIVTSDYHLKRSKLIYDRLNDGTFDFKYISSLTPDGLTWDERPDSKQLWWSEFKKTWGYAFGLYKFIDSPDSNDNI